MPSIAKKMSIQNVPRIWLMGESFGLWREKHAGSPPTRDGDRFSVMAKILVFGSEGAQIKSSFIGDPGRAKRATEVVAPSIHRKYNQVVRHMTNLSRHIRRRNL
ncbi:hypothetical protein TNCV_4794691 [Trichonephila clavipes]|nr:hypothetical protein TNCV_4794691 [Trichonephila clavipes]